MLLISVLLIGVIESGTLESTGSNNSMDSIESKNWIICKKGETLFYHGQCLQCLSSDPALTYHNFSEMVTASDVINHFQTNNEARLTIRKKVGQMKPTSVQVSKMWLKRNSMLQETSDFYECPRSVQAFRRKSVQIGAIHLNGRVLNVVTIQRHPFSKVFGNGTSYSGVIFEILDALQKKYNFSMNTFTPPDGNWGSKGKDGSWNGMIGLLVRKEADLGAASFSITIERAKVVDFTFAIHQEPTGILIPAPVEGEKFTVLIRPLSKEVWISLFVTIGVIAPSFYAFHICSLSIKEDKTVKVKTFLSTMAEIFLFITGSMVQESVISPMNKTTRFLIGIWWMITLVLANTYVAFLVSYLAAPKLYNIVNSLEELSQQSQIKWTFRKGTAHQTLFQSESSTGVFKTIGDAVSENDLVTSDADGVLKVLEGKYAFIKEKSYLDVALGADFDAHQKCRLTLTKESFYTVGIAIAVQQEAKYRTLLDYEISNAVATGLMEKWKYLHWAKSLWCVDAASYIVETHPQTRKLDLDDVSGAYFLLTCGLTFGCIVFLMEQFTACTKQVHSVLTTPPEPEPVQQTVWVTMK